MAKRINWRKEVEWAFRRLGDNNDGSKAPSGGSQALLTWARENQTAFFNLIRPFIAKLATAEEVEALTDDGVDVTEAIAVCRTALKDEAEIGELEESDVD